MLITLVFIIESNCQKVISSARTIQLMESESSYDQLCIYDYAYKCDWLQGLMCTMNKCKCKFGDIFGEKVPRSALMI